MYNIHSHYENLLALAKTIITQATVTYLHPFGSTQIENVEFLDISGNGPVLFCYDQEPLLPDYTRDLFNYVSQIRDTQGEPRNIILLNTERNSEAKNQILAETNFIDSYYFFHAFAAADWYRGYQYCKSLTLPTYRKIKKKYITFNRITGKARSYRSLFVGELAKRNLLDYGHVSYSDDCPEHGHYSRTIYDAADYGIPADYLNEIKNILDEVVFPLRIDHKDKPTIPNGSQILSAIPECMESFLHVVTETCFWDTKDHLTEKIFKPIVSKQPFVLLGCPNNLAYLKSYGFKTFDRWWDESYDNITDPIERIQAVVKIIEEICNMSDCDLEGMLRGMNHVLEYNYNRFYSEEFLNEVWNELEVNLRRAIAQSSRRTSEEN